MSYRVAWLLASLSVLVLAAAPRAQELPLLYTLDGPAGLEVGRAVAGLPDLDGDGVGEVALGMTGPPPTIGVAGAPVAQVQVFSGRTGAALLTIEAGSLFGEDSPDPGLPVELFGFSFGSAVAALGDADGDGVPDLAVGMPDVPGLLAQVGVFSGADGSLISVSLGAPGDRYGAVLAGLGDINGDQRADLLVGAPDAGGGQGSARVVSGATGATLLSLVAPPGEGRASARFGSAVAGLDDLDQGGVSDLAVGAPGVDEVFIFRGEDGASLGSLLAAPADTDFGASLASGVDIDGDGRGDLIVGAPAAFGGRGAVFLYNDRSAPFLFQVVSERQTSGFGAAVGLAGDVDDDGFDDVLAAAPQDSVGFLGEAPVPSQVVTISGKTGQLLTEWLAPGPGVELGAGLGYLGDLFGGGTDAFVLGAPGAGGFLGVSTGQGQVAFVPSASDQNAFGEPTNALAGRPGGPALLALPLSTDGRGGFQDIDFGPVVAVPKADGDSVVSELLSAKTSAFAELGEIPVGNLPQQAAGSDFNRDGRDDYATANAGDDTVSVVLTADTTFSGAGGQTLSTGFNAEPRALVAGDLDGDDAPDLVAAGLAGLSVFLNDGNGVLALASSPLVADVTDLQLGDLDGDGHVDVLTVSGALPDGGGPAFGSAKVLLGAGDGTFVHGDGFASGSAVASVQLGDLDLDGDLDALLCTHKLVGSLAQARITGWLNDGAGQFAPAPGWSGLLSTDANGTVPTYGALADLDRDGDLDAVYTRTDNVAAPVGTYDDVQPPLQVLVLTNAGVDAGVWHGLTSQVLGTAYTGKAVEPILADVFTDPNEPDAEDPDLILVWWVDELAGQGGVSQKTSLIGLLIGDGQGSFFDPAPNQFVLGDEPGDGDSGDVGGFGFDGLGPDGRADLVFPNLVDNSLKLLLGDGAGGIAEVLTIGDIDQLDPETLGDGVWSGGPRQARVVQLDDDGLADVLVYNDWREEVFGQSSASLTLLLNDGAGGLVVSDYVPLPRAGEVALEQLDGQPGLDAVLTLRVGGSSDDRVVVMHASGPGRFGAPAQVLDAPTRDLTGGLAVAALADPGPLWVVTSSRSPGTGEGVLLAWQVRDGVLDEAVVQSALGTSWGEVESLLLDDLDGDGRADALLGTAEGRLVVAYGDGQGRFERVPMNPSTEAVGGGQLVMGQLDGDGHPDLVSSKGAGAIQAGVHLLRGLGGAEFNADALAGVQSSGALGAQRPVLVDLDGDLTTDIVLSHGTSNSISILLSDLGQVQQVAVGKPGSGGVTPTLEIKGYTTAGGTLRVSTGQALGGSVGALLVGSGPLPSVLPAMSSLDVLVPLVFGGEPGQPGAGGEQQFVFRLPKSPEFVGLELVVQVLVADPGAASPPVGIAASPALTVTIVE